MLHRAGRVSRSSGSGNVKHLVYLLLIPISSYAGPLGAVTLFVALWAIYYWLASEGYLGYGDEGRKLSFLVTLGLGALTYTNVWCILGILAFIAYWALLCL